MNYAIVWRSIVTLLCVFTVIVGEQVGKFAYKGFPEQLHTRTIKLPKDMVAADFHVMAGDIANIVSQNGPSSLFFIIDNSGSMNGFTGVGSSHTLNDAQGTRFKVAQEVIKLIAQKAPPTEIGLAVFSKYLRFDKRDDPLFVATGGNTSNGCYLPLLTLNKDYNGKQGSDVLLDYLKYKMYPGNSGNVNKDYAQLEYVPTNRTLADSSKTSVVLSQAATREAMQSSKFPKKKHYVIFFSDGAGDNPDFVKAEGMPTTFCIYFHGKFTNPPMALSKMIDNTKTNGYSTSNNLSSIQGMQAGFATVMQYVEKNILSEIITKIYEYTPKKLATNGINNPSPWDNNKNLFLYKNLFPLTKTPEDFTYDLVYKVVKTENGNQQQLPDTTTNSKVTFELNGTTVPDSFAVQYWDRNLKLFSGSTELNNGDIIDGSTPNKLELRFDYKKIDTLYDYEKEGIEIIVESKDAGDKEKFTLTKNGSYYSAEFSHEPGSANSGDGKLQYSNPDEISCIFRNPKLPLDTIRLDLIYANDFIFTVSKGTYFDTKADGKVDKIEFNIAGKKAEDYEAKILDEIEKQLPSWRNFSVSKKSISGNTATFEVSQGLNDLITSIESGDKFEIKDTITLEDDVFIAPSKFTFTDKMAPVIVSATCIDSLKTGALDELIIEFSEKVKSVKKDEPFNFITNNGNTKYEVTVDEMSNSGKSVSFKIKDVDGVSMIEQNDTIWIDHKLSSNIYDDDKNNQDNKDNLRQPINVEVINEGIDINKAVYLDRDADGKIDLINMTIYNPKAADYLDEVVKSITLPAFRDFKKGTPTYKNKVLSLEVEERNSDFITNVTSKDIIEIKKKIELPDSLFIFPCKVTPIDSVAPVIVKASLVDKFNLLIKGQKTEEEDIVEDELTVHFSEPLNKITDETPLQFFKRSDNSDFQAELEVTSQKDDKTVFTVKKYIKTSKIKNKDLVCINWDTKDIITDKESNLQDNDENRRVPITVKTKVDTVPVEMPYDLLLEGTIVYRNTGISIDKKLLSKLEKNKDLKEQLRTLKDNKKDDKYFNVSVITIRPDDDENFSDIDNITAMVSIYDAVGNTVMKPTAMVFDRNTRKCYFVWDSRSSQNGFVGTNTYMINADITRYFNGQAVQEYSKKLLIGVSQK